MKIAYIAHPIGGDVENNLIRIRAIVRRINLTEPETVPFAPYYADVLSMDDEKPIERARGIKNDLELIKRLRPDELRLYGNRISVGMYEEIRLAAPLGIPIIAMTPETATELYAMYEVEPSIFKSEYNIKQKQKICTQ